MVFLGSLQAEALPTSFRIFYLAVAIAIAYILGLMVVQRLFLRVLLSYKGWMWEGRRPSFFTLVWGASLRAVYVFGRHPSLYSFQNALPALPAPSLRASCTRLLDSVKPVMSPAEYVGSHDGGGLDVDASWRISVRST